MATVEDIDQIQNPEDILLSVCMITYCHQDFIAAAIEGVLMQQLSGKIELVISDDMSPDRTREVCKQYQKRYPDRIRLLLPAANLGMMPNFIQCIEKCRGKYIALCEGDDYWTDPLKLQKQVDFLEAHPKYSMCFHAAMKLKSGVEEPFHVPDTVDLNDVHFADLLVSTNFIATSSVVYRNALMPLPTWFQELPFGDLGIYFLNSRKGKVKCLDELMSVYRIHAGGVWTGRSRTAQLEGWLRFFDIVWPLLTTDERAIAKQRRKSALDHFAHERYPVNPRRMKIYRYYLGGLFALRGHV